MRLLIQACLLAFLGVSACAPLAGRAQGPAGGPESLLLTFDRPRREKAGVGERWVVARQGSQPYLLHAWDVERRRTLQTCGAVPNDAFVAGWEDLDEAGLLVAGEDLRLAPSAGDEPFAGRLQVRFRDQGRSVSARRPLSAGDTVELLRVLRRWEAGLRAADPMSLPAELRVEVAIGGCEPPGPRHMGPNPVPR